MASRILVVEDEQAIRDMLCFVLDQHGYECIEADNYQSSLDKLVEPYPDLILLDWMFPGGSGIKLLKQLKQDELNRISATIRRLCEDVEMIILFGSYARGDWKEEIDLVPV